MGLRTLSIEKVTINIGVGEAGEPVEKATKLLSKLTGQKPVKTKTTKRIPAFGVRPGLFIGCKVTLRKKKADEFLVKAFHAIDNIIQKKWFDKFGNFSFGIPEYIELKDTRYDPSVGIFGLSVCVTIQRIGYRVKKRRYKRAKIPLKHMVKKDEAIEFISKKFGLKVA
jgi:large subunit ribosomal protein L5